MYSCWKYQLMLKVEKLKIIIWNLSFVQRHLNIFHDFFEISSVKCQYLPLLFPSWIICLSDCIASFLLRLEFETKIPKEYLFPWLFRQMKSLFPFLKVFSWGCTVLWYCIFTPKKLLIQSQCEWKTVEGSLSHKIPYQYFEDQVVFVYTKSIIYGRHEEINKFWTIGFATIKKNGSW